MVRVRRVQNPRVCSDLTRSRCSVIATAGAGGAGYAYSKLNNPRAAAIAGGFSLLYLFAGWVKSPLVGCESKLRLLDHWIVECDAVATAPSVVDVDHGNPGYSDCAHCMHLSLATGACWFRGMTAWDTTW
jgi:hypothetical protein